MITLTVGSGEDYWTDEAISGLVGQVVNLKNVPGLPTEVPSVITAAERHPENRFLVTLTIEVQP